MTLAPPELISTDRRYRLAKLEAAHGEEWIANKGSSLVQESDSGRMIGREARFLEGWPDRPGLGAKVRAKGQGPSPAIWRIFPPAAERNRVRPFASLDHARGTLQAYLDSVNV